MFEKLMFEKSRFIWQGINGNTDGTEIEFERSIVFELSELELQSNLSIKGTQEN
jgi:hypothetical protein